jgi:hypothetical protein
MAPVGLVKDTGGKNIRQRGEDAVNLVEIVSNKSMIGLIIVGLLNILTGCLVVILSYRLSGLRKSISEMEQRISRLEVIMDLSSTRPSRDSTHRDKKTSEQGLTRVRDST